MHRRRQEYGAYQRGKGEESKANKYTETEGDQTLGVEHTVQYTDNILTNCTLKTYIMLPINVFTINIIKKKKNQKEFLKNTILDE